MAQIITNNFKVYVASQIVESLSNTSMYLFVGRPQTWANELTPPTPIDTLYQDNQYWADSIAAKRIIPTDAKQVVKRYDWTAGVAYAQYDNESRELLTQQFYVLTTDYNVYKCISNNDSAVSTVKPTGRSTEVFKTSDSYEWKFLYSLTDSDILKFLTAEYMPVNTTPDIVSTAISGSLDSIIVENAGSGYTSNTDIVATIQGDGAGAIIGSILTTSANTLDKIILTAHGSGYKFANITISGGAGTNATARAVISPLNGHGHDVAEELGAYYVMINTRLDYAAGQGDFPVVNDYRRIGIVQNPISRLTNAIATETTLDSTYTLNLSNVSGTFTIDEILRSDNVNANAFVVSANVTSGNAVIRYITPADLRLGNISYSVGEIVRGANSMASGRITSITTPEILHDTGKVLYVDNRRKITRTFDQAENVHIVIEL